PLPAVTHRYKRARCLWLEQFQIAEYLRLAAIRDWRRVAHISARSGSWRGPAGLLGQWRGHVPAVRRTMADLHDPPSLRPVPAALSAAASRAGSRSATKTRC